MSRGRNVDTAHLFRMVTPDHVCPFGLKSKSLLEREAYDVKDHHLKCREEINAFQQKHNVDTTPQTFIGEKRIGGYEELEGLFRKEECAGG